MEYGSIYSMKQYRQITYSKLQPLLTHILILLLLIDYVYLYRMIRYGDVVLKTIFCLDMALARIYVYVSVSSCCIYFA